jgi:hypothetical protein
MYICMLHFHLCIISCLHLCTIDCICNICHGDVLLLYALLTMICWWWGYDIASDAHEMYSYALGSLGIYTLVNAFLFVKNAIWSSLVGRMPFMYILGAYGYIFLNLCLEPCSFHLGSKIHLSSWMFSVHATLWRSLSFFQPQRHFMYHAQIVNHETGMWNAYASKMCFHVINVLNSLSWVPNRCMMFTNEKSHI